MSTYLVTVTLQGEPVLAKILTAPSSAAAEALGLFYAGVSLMKADRPSHLLHILRATVDPIA